MTQYEACENVANCDASDAGGGLGWGPSGCEKRQRLRLIGSAENWIAKVACWCVLLFKLEGMQVVIIQLVQSSHLGQLTSA